MGTIRDTIKYNWQGNKQIFKALVGTKAERGKLVDIYKKDLGKQFKKRVKKFNKSSQADKALLGLKKTDKFFKRAEKSLKGSNNPWYKEMAKDGAKSSIKYMNPTAKYVTERHDEWKKIDKQISNNNKNVKNNYNNFKNDIKQFKFAFGF